MAEEDVCEAIAIPIENEHWLKRLHEPGLSLLEVVAAPASEVFSVRVCPKYFGERDTCEVYGDIVIEDDEGTQYELYCRPRDDPQILTLQNNLLSLGMPDECAVSTTWLRMELSLKDKSAADGDNDSVIVDQVLAFDKLTRIHQYDRLNVRQLASGSVSVTYASFSAAVVAIVRITLIQTNATAPAPFDLHGQIVARYGNTYGQKFPGILLFNQLPTQSVTAEFNVPIDLCKDVVVVPAQSFIRIDLRLHLSQPSANRQEDLVGRAEFLAGYLCTIDNLDIPADDFLIRVNVEWRHPYELKSPVEKPVKPLKLSTDVPEHSKVVSREPYLRVHRAKGYKLAEVFTVMIHQDSDSELKIIGTMGIDDRWVYSDVFKRDEFNPLILSKNRESIPLEGPFLRCFNARATLNMVVDLRDIDCRMLIEGDVGWNERLIERAITWYDRRICSVIKGVHGYATVFYTLFSKATQADVKILYTSKGDPNVSQRVHGTVVARHSNETYLTEFEKEYYQSVLFRGRSSELKSGCELPLLKSVVAVPTDASLTIDVNLYASALSGEVPQAHWKDNLVFEIVPETRIPKVIRDGIHCIEVSVEWIDTNKLYLQNNNFMEVDYETIFEV